MIQIPPYLQSGDTIAIVCPGGYMPMDRAQTCIDTLGNWGYRVQIGATLGGNSSTYFSGTDNERLADLQGALDDPSVKAILCGRGGYGIGRIIDKIDFSRFVKEPKWIIGFSDVTVLHAHIYSNYKIATLHAPMAGAFNDGGADLESVRSLRQALEGKISRIQCNTHPFNRRGEAIGELVGGNLSLLAHLTGTSSSIKTKGRILFLEDVGEYLYNADRMLFQLLRSGKLDRIAGLIVGGFTEMKDTSRPYGRTIEEIIRDIVQPFDYPVCFGFPVSHGKENCALKVGVGYKLKVSKKRALLEE